MYLAGLADPRRGRPRTHKARGRADTLLLQRSLAFETGVVALTIEDRERILRALDDVRTDALAELRGVLLSEHEWRAREGLI